MKLQSLLITSMIFLFGLVIFSFYQGRTISVKKKTIKTQLDSLYNLQRALTDEQASRRSIERENESLSERNKKLEAETDRLNIEIDRLENEIRQLKAAIRNQRKTIREVEDLVAQKEIRIMTLRTEMDSLRRKNPKNSSLLSGLEREQNLLESQIDSLLVQSDTLILQQDSLVNTMLDKEEEEYNYKTQIEIIERAEVTFSLVAPRKETNGSEINRVKKNNWNHTLIELSLFHENMEWLADQTFVVRIIDSDSKKALPLRESNPEFPDSEINAKGLFFKFQSNPILLRHVNNEAKSGSNYEIHVYLVLEDRELLLRQGMQDFVRNGKVVPIGF